MSNRNKIILAITCIVVGVGLFLIFPQQREQNKTNEEVSTIDYFVEHFNKVNPDKPIDKESVENYYHHGTTHDDQIIFNRDNYEIVVTKSYGNEYKTIIDTNAENDESIYKALYLEFIKVYLPNLSNEDSIRYWEQMKESDTKTLEVDKFESRLQMFNGEIEQLALEGTIE